jgi:hypothetical protein
MVVPEPAATVLVVAAAAVGDNEVYTDVKDRVVDLAIEVAEEWAATTGWRP